MTVKLRGDFARRYDAAAGLLDERNDVMFVTHRLAHARVIYINAGWFLEHQTDVRVPSTRTRVCDWLLQQFGFAIREGHDPPDAFVCEERVFRADRYGGSGTGPNGGSGRCGTSGAFQVKGIGRTPLVGSGNDFNHSHGAMTLEEAIRETIFAKYSNERLPYGAVCTIALISTGTVLPWGERRSLLVREAFFRASSLQRAENFNPPRQSASNRLLDVDRVRNAWRMWGGLLRSGEDSMPADVDSFARRVVRQLASAHASHFYCGPCSTSNLALSGAALDFGSARIVPSWRAARSVAGAPRFGVEDIVHFAECCEELAFFARKYGPTTQRAAPDGALGESILDSYWTELQRCFSHWSSEYPSVAREVSGLLLAHFRKQQDIHCEIAPTGEDEPAGDAAIAGYEGISFADYKAIRAIEVPLFEKARGGLLAKRAADAIVALLKQAFRVNIHGDRETLQKRIYMEVAECANFENDADLSERFIENAVRSLDLAGPWLPACSTIETDPSEGREPS